MRLPLIAIYPVAGRAVQMRCGRCGSTDAVEVQVHLITDVGDNPQVSEAGALRCCPVCEPHLFEEAPDGR